MSPSDFSKEQVKDLRQILCDLYPDDASLKRVCDDAGFDFTAISGSTMRDKWHSVIVFAQRTNRIETLIAGVKEEYPGALIASERYLGIQPVSSPSSAIHADSLRSASPRTQQTHPITPGTLRTFVGRTAELQKIQEFFSLHRGVGAIFVVHGLSGIGKTQLVRKLIDDFGDRYGETFLVDGTDDATIASEMSQYAASMQLADYDPSNPTRSADAFLSADDPT